MASMSGRSILNAIALGGWLFASVVAFMIVAYTSFFGVGVVGAGVSPGFLAHQVKTRAEMSPGERAALREQQSVAARSARFFKHLGMILTAGGFTGFWFFQL